MSFTYYCGCGYRTDDIDAVEHEPDEGKCCNCSGRQCMDCVLRYMHDRCVHDCPDCRPTP